MRDAEHLPESVRLALLEAHQSRHESELRALDAVVNKLVTGLAVLRAKVAIYSALGSFAGGAIVAGLTVVLGR